ncbi:kinesin-like protein kif11 [Nannochloropsis oceanica]
MEGSSDASNSSTNIQVAVRCRPINSDEEKRGFVPIVSTDTERRQIKINYGQGMKKVSRTFTLDRVFGRFATQEDVYKQTVAPMVDEMLAGFSCTTFCYGQTGTGKTHTMEGELSNIKNYGLLPRAIISIFEKLDASDADYTVRASYLEIYQENLEDLLAAPASVAAPASSSSSSSSAAAGGKGKGLRLMEDVKKGVVVLGLEEVNCTTAEATIALLQKGVNNRQTAATLCNKNSSRSHGVFTLKVVVKQTNAAGEEEIRAGQLNLVDLAGSECIGRSGAKNERAREAGNINQSLLTLGRCITALTEGHPHIPYRDSKLTRLLQESLGGRAKTCIIATLSPVASNVEETLSTLEYALKAKSIKNKPELNARSTSRTLIKEYNSEIESLKSMLMATREKNGVYLAPADYDHLQAQLQSQGEQIKESEQALRQREEELEEAVGVRSELQNQVEEATEALQASKEALSGSRREVQRLGRELQETKSQLIGTRAVVAEQVRTEEALRGQATMLLQSLREARNDVVGLVAKVGRTTEELQLRSERAMALVTDCERLLGEAQEGVVGMGKMGSVAAEALEGAVRAFVEKEVKEMGQALQSLGGEVDLLVKDGGEAAGRVGREMCARLSKEIVEMLVQESRVQSQAMLQRAHDYRQAAEVGSREVRGVFDKMADRVDQALKSMLKHLDDGKLQIQEVVAQHASAAEGLQGQLSKFAETWKNDMEYDAQSRATHVHGQNEMVKALSKALLKTVEGQLDEMMKECSKYGCDYLQDMENMAMCRQANVEKFAGTAQTSLRTMNGGIAENLGNTLTSHLDPTLALTHGLQSQLEETDKPATAAAVAKVDAEAKSLIMGLEAATAAADVKMQETLQSGAAVIKSIEAETRKVEELLQSKGKGVSNAMGAAAQAASARLTGQAQDFNVLLQSSLAEPLAAGVSTVVAQVQESEALISTYGTAAGQVTAPTTITPTKREYLVPGALSATRPHAEIMAQVAAHDFGVENVQVTKHRQVQEPAQEEESQQEQQEVDSPVPMAISSSSNTTEKRALQADDKEAAAAAAEAVVPASAGTAMNEVSPSKKRRLSAGEENQPPVVEEIKVEESTTKLPLQPPSSFTFKALEETDVPTAPVPVRIKTSRIPRPVKPLGANKGAR